MSLAADLRTLFHLTLSPIHGASHAERLESFYRPHAGRVRSFSRAVVARPAGIVRLPAASQRARWIDLGGGTARTLNIWAIDWPTYGKCSSSIFVRHCWRSRGDAWPSAAGRMSRSCRPTLHSSCPTAGRSTS